ncbi:MAG: protein phosphatase 2C domain-containing protein [Chloroflexota bacterium]|nr:protein phosphatase 2C domain-containing protein [Chloroflexota bacterium]
MPTKGDGPALVAVVSDGAGSAPEAEAGSRLACSMLSDEVVKLLQLGGTTRDVTREFAQSMITDFQREVLLRADAKALKLRDFACTLLLAAIDGQGAAFLQIGDGAIVVGPRQEPDQYCWVFWPQRGEYENQTIFVTDVGAPDHLDHEFVDAPIDEVALLSDGLQRLALHYQSQTVHAPFFRPMFAPLRATPTGFSAPLSSSLAGFLESKPVNERTDDDKTLILATRRAAGITADHRDDADEREDQTEGL